LLVLRQEIGVPSQSWNAGVLGRLEGARHGRGIGWRNSDAVDTLRNQILNDLNLFGFGVLARADIDAFDIAEFLLRLLAAIARKIEEGIIHGLRHEGKTELVLRICGRDKHH
jgi:hypothetical protein